MAAADMKELSRELVHDLHEDGWHFYADLSGPEPFDVFFTKTVGELVKRIDPLTLVLELNEFNDPDHRLTGNELLHLAYETPNTWVVDSIASSLAVDQ